MQLIINGQEIDVPNIVETNCNLSLLDIINSFQLNPDQTAIEKNGVIIDKADYHSETVNEGDRLELIRFMGGGN